MTPSEILNKTFQRGMNGYKTDEVNQFLGEAGSYAKQLERENTELQAKIEVLAEKIEEYRTDEESLRAALIGAQKLGDSVIREAKTKAQSILDVAAKQADDIIGDAKRNVELENYSLEKKKLEAAKFKKQLETEYARLEDLINALPKHLMSILKQHKDLINALPYDEDRLSPLPEKPSAVRPSVRDIPSEEEAARPAAADDSVAAAVQEEFGDIRLAFDEVGEQDTDEKFPRRKSRFGNLKFGEGFDPIRDE